MRDCLRLGVRRILWQDLFWLVRGLRAKESKIKSKVTPHTSLMPGRLILSSFWCWLLYPAWYPAWYADWYPLGCWPLEW